MRAVAPPVTQEEALHAFRTLGRLLQETYDVKREALLAEIEPTVPARIFSGSLSPYQSLATHLHHQGLSAKEIAKATARNKTFVKQSIKEAKLDTTGEALPLRIFSQELSVLEAAAHELKRRGHTNKEIAQELNKDSSTVWTVLDRAEKKLRGERA